LVEALARPAANGAHLVLVGSPGWGGVDIASVAASAGVAGDRLHVLGRLEDDDLAAALFGAGVLAAPSRSEGFGLPVLEAMAAGVPVVVSDAPALVELAGGVGLVVPRDDPARLAVAIGEVLGDDGAASAMAEHGRRRAADFSWQTAASRLWDLHTAVVPGDARSAAP
jgi:glycosyltransferase involved in cell wall biosynthesis